MAVEPNTNQPTPNPQDAGNEGGQKKLYAGKFETVEAMEKGYLEAEKGFHETRQVRQEVQELRELMETRLAPIDEYNRGVATTANPISPTDGSQTLTRF